MDVNELRNAFIGSDSLIERIRSIHMLSVSGARSADLGLSVTDDPVAITSVIPLDVLRARRDLDVAAETAILPFSHTAVARNHRITLEGILSYTVHGPDQVQSYAVTHRQGRVIGLWSIGGKRQVGPSQLVRYVFPFQFELGLRDVVTATQARLRQAAVDGPCVVFTSILGVVDHKLQLSEGSTSSPAYRREAHLPEVMGEVIDNTTLLPVFRAFWRLFGEERPHSVAWFN